MLALDTAVLGARLRHVLRRRHVNRPVSTRLRDSHALRVPTAPEIQPEDLVPFERYGDVFGDEALMVVAVGATMKPTMASVAMNAMAWCWSHKDARGKPRQGGARPEVQESTMRLGERLDPNEISMELTGELEAILNRQGYEPEGATLAWITFCAALATEAFTRGLATSDEYHLLADPFLIGTALTPADGITPTDMEIVRASTATRRW